MRYCIYFRLHHHSHTPDTGNAAALGDIWLEFVSLSSSVHFLFVKFTPGWHSRLAEATGLARLTTKLRNYVASHLKFRISVRVFLDSASWKCWKELAIERAASICGGWDHSTPSTLPTRHSRQLTANLWFEGPVHSAFDLMSWWSRE